MMKQLLLCLWLMGMLCATESIAQTMIWRSVEKEVVKGQGIEYIVPDLYQSIYMDMETLKDELKKAPSRFSTNGKTQKITFPVGENQTMTFDMVKSPMMEEGLAAKFPNIKTYFGTAKENPLIKGYFDVTDAGFHAMIFLPDHQVWFIDPYSVGETHYYKGYFKKDLKKDLQEVGQCWLDDDGKAAQHADVDESEKNSHFCALINYRLAVAATGEYSEFHGGTQSGVMSAIVTTINRVNGIYEQDLGVHFNLVDDNDELIYLNEDTDPFTSGDAFALTDECQETIDDVIGINNYDVGHVFSRGGGGGLAQVGAVCTGLKATGASEIFTPVGDFFDVAFVAHELGHQFGATHTFNYPNDDICGPNMTQFSAMEPGSGTTIMAYAGACINSIQLDTDPYFHAASIGSMSNYIVFGAGGACGMVTDLNNDSPTVDGGQDYIIPRSTPFMLTAEGSDPNGDFLSYCWEQYDHEAADMPPSANSTQGPLFRSFPPNASPTRFFPNLESLANNLTPTWEVLPNVTRPMDFRVTVRDNHDGLGCTDSDNVRVTVEDDAGPFIVTKPNASNTVWEAGTMRNVTWIVANTNEPPINATEVDILLSTDGGLTYPYTLAVNVPNDGSDSVFVPNLPGSNNRIMIKGSNNIFFDISNQDFTITTCSNCGNGVRINPIVLLQGAMLNNGGSSLMRDDLRAGGHLPTKEPYKALDNFAHLGSGGNEEISSTIFSNTGSTAVVDWVYVDLRLENEPETVVASRAALLRRDGSVKDINGVSSLQFPTVPPGDYYVAVRHRNHLGVMTAQPQGLTYSPKTINFTSSATPTYGQNAQVVLANNRRALWTGNADVISNIIFQGANNDPNGVFFKVLTAPTNSGQLNYIFEGYHVEDLDMGGQVIYQGSGNEANTIFFNVFSHPQNTSLIANFIIQEQLP